MLVEGDDHNEPVADAVRAILDGHIVMERQIAERGRYPAINVLKSVSRTMPRSADQAYLPVHHPRPPVMATYADMEELIRLGAYRTGSSAEVDEAIRLHPPLEAFLAQTKDDSTGLGQGYQRLEQILAHTGNRKLTLSGHTAPNGLSVGAVGLPGAPVCCPWRRQAGGPASPGLRGSTS